MGRILAWTTAGILGLMGGVVIAAGLFDIEEWWLQIMVTSSGVASVLLGLAIIGDQQ